MLTERLEAILQQAVAEGITPSAVCQVAVDGARQPAVVVGDAVRFGPEGTELPASQRTPASAGTLYDLASVTKVFTAVTALTLVDAGMLELDAPLGRWLPDFRTGGKESATLRQLMTHTAGLAPVWSGWRPPLESGLSFDRSALLADLIALPLAAPPGTVFEYSCVGFNTIVALAEAVTGRAWPELVTERVLDKLPPGLTFTPEFERCAATEYQPEFGRQMVRGTVHDESAWALGGAGGNAGLFGMASAMLDFGEALRAGLPGILSAGTAAEMWRDQLPQTLGTRVHSGSPGYGHGLGLRIGQQDWMGRAGTAARGHNGFTGTSFLVDKQSGITVVLLTNRVHPRRDRSDVQPLRGAIADAVYCSLS